MPDFPYRPEDVNEDVRPIFDQLLEEFGDSYQIWRRIEDFGRRLSAGILDPETRVAVIIALRTGTGARSSRLSESEIEQIRTHFASGATEDLVL